MAPILAGLVKGGLSLLANAFLVKGKEWVEEKTGVALNPEKELSSEDLAKLKQFELTNEVDLARLRHEDNRLDAELEKAYLGDRQDARKRDTEYVKAGKRNERADNLAYLAVGGLLGCALLVFLVELTPGQREILIYILGALTVLVKDVYGFEFGSSRDAAGMNKSMQKWLDEE